MIKKTVRRVLLLMLFIPFLSGYGEVPLRPVKPWKQGMYAEYYKEFHKGSWETYRIFISRRLKENTWEVFVTVKNPEYELTIKYSAFEDWNRTSSPIRPEGFIMIRGEKIGKQEFMTLTAFCMNLFALRNLYSSALEKKSFKPGGASYGCDIKSTLRVDDPWPEFGYVQLHDFHPDIPITGLAGTETSDGRFRMKIAAYGISTFDMNGYEPSPSYVDFGHHRKIDYGQFRVAFPATWVLVPIKRGDDQSRYATIYEGNVSPGGNTHSAIMMIIIRKGSGTENRIFFEARKRSLPLELNKSTGLELDFLEDRTVRIGSAAECHIYTYGHKHPSEVGIKKVGLLLAKDDSAVAEIVLFANFSRNNPRRTLLNSLGSEMEKIILSFSFH